MDDAAAAEAEAPCDPRLPGVAAELGEGCAAGIAAAGPVVPLVAAPGCELPGVGGWCAGTVAAVVAWRTDCVDGRVTADVEVTDGSVGVVTVTVGVVVGVATVVVVIGVLTVTVVAGRGTVIVVRLGTPTAPCDGAAKPTASPAAPRSKLRPAGRSRRGAIWFVIPGARPPGTWPMVQSG